MSHTARPSADQVRNAIDLLVLAVLADGPQYGYAITKLVAARSGGSLRLTPGVLYPLLHQMENHGLLLSNWETIKAAGNDDEDGGRKRKWYRLSARGRRRLSQRISAHRAWQSIIESFIPTLEQGKTGS